MHSGCSHSRTRDTLHNDALRVINAVIDQSASGNVIVDLATLLKYCWEFAEKERKVELSADKHEQLKSVLAVCSHVCVSAQLWAWRPRCKCTCVRDTFTLDQYGLYMLQVTPQVTHSTGAGIRGMQVLHQCGLN